MILAPIYLQEIILRKLFPLLLILIISGACSSSRNETKPKKLILLIGDGMGPQQISMLYYFLKYSKQGKGTEFGFEKFKDDGSLAISATEPHDKIVVDSACSATQLATGARSRSEMIGLDIDGNTKLTILEKAKRAGLKTGLVSDTRITHATPAAFASHVANRWSEDEIAEELIKTAPDVLYSGGIRQFVPKGFNGEVAGIKVKSKRSDSKNLLEAAKKNYSVFHTKSELNKNTSKKSLGLFASSAMPDAITVSNTKNNKDREVPTLLEMTKSAVHKLNSHQGYFLMVEGGQIDWAGHANDAGTLLHEMLNFNETLLWLLDYVESNPDTLLVVTADHETGGFGFSYHVDDLPEPQKLSGDQFKGKQFRPNYNYGDFSVLDKLYNQKQSLGSLVENFYKLPRKDQTKTKLYSMVKSAVEFEVDKKDIDRVLNKIKNPFLSTWNRGLKTKMVPEIKEFKAFFASKFGMESAVIARAMAAKQSIVWGSTGHTATPVFVFSKGGEGFHKNFKGYINHKKVGQLMQEYLDL
jgi:alkaline phosphatase